ncbi:flagellar basal body rod protein FlgG [Thalassobacillus pellis]|uniref:flagellar basal body rod protein FlgG n=1 Tax=Thalassobacillus pellis TaxID=748008 RepID=UPI001961780B|nr:flagellar basal body rod protein FlgG [Thalassobacillus pellis]MBM7552744.1 flagellar hook protein FlgE [Thalassobacillus pellis]
MLRSMYAGISGMKGFQTKLDTIANNIANVNTYGYKKGRTTFQDMMSQTISGAQGPTQFLGGKNASQVGLGAQLGSIDTIHTQGNRQTTNRPLDLAIEGDGMFVLAEDIGAGNVLDSTLSFTRAGNFYLDNNGYIVNSNGQYLVGADSTGAANRIAIPPEAQSFSIQSNGTVTYVDDNNNAINAGQIRLARFSNPGGLEKIGGNMFRATNNSGGNFTDINNLMPPGQGGTGQTVAGALEMSNVDLAEEFTEMITAQRGFQANTRIITTSDEILQELVNLKR